MNVYTSSFADERSSRRWMDEEEKNICTRSLFFLNTQRWNEKIADKFYDLIAPLLPLLL
jgi:hypothetical protein